MKKPTIKQARELAEQMQELYFRLNPDATPWKNLLPQTRKRGTTFWLNVLQHPPQIVLDVLEVER